VAAAAIVIGGPRGETLTGTEGRDLVIGHRGNDVLAGLGGNDRLRGGGGDDTVDGGAGDDRLGGGRGADSLAGGEGDDRLFALVPDGTVDTLDCGAGAGDVARVRAEDVTVNCETVTVRS
jgi:Ca2+-binding RTX toxin-like protein